MLYILCAGRKMPADAALNAASAPNAGMGQARLAIARRPFLDLPLGSGAPPSGAPANGSASAEPAHAGQGSGSADRLAIDPDFDLNSTFDVPAFLRRQEG